MNQSVHLEFEGEVAVNIPDRLCEAGLLGRKVGSGYYMYVSAAGNSRQIDYRVENIIAASRAEKGIYPRQFADSEIQRRALLAMVNEAALPIAEGVATRATDVDVVLINGYGFPRWEGGPVFWARQRGRANLEFDLDWLAEVSGAGFVRGDLEHLTH